MPTTPTPDDDEDQGQPRTVRVPVGDRDPMTGRFREFMDVDEDAAAHWDASRWERLS